MTSNHKNVYDPYGKINALYVTLTSTLPEISPLWWLHDEHDRERVVVKFM